MMKRLQKQRQEGTSSMDFPQDAVKFLLKNDDYCCCWIQSILDSPQPLPPEGSVMKRCSRPLSELTKA